MQKWDYDIIGTHLTLLIDTQDDCTYIFQGIGNHLRDFEQKYSRFIEWNWLYNLNNSRRAILDSDGKNMLSFMLNVARNTDGYFDPTVGKRLTELGYGVQWKMKNEQWIMLGKKFGNYKDIEISWDEVILHGDILLEFGWVGKWYLIDVIKDMIYNWLCHIKMTKTRFLINFGWDMYGCGGWKVGLESPFAPDEVIGTYMLDDAFLSCSAWTKRKWGNHHHLINPHTGESATETIASYVEWISWAMTDAYATTLCVMPWDMAIETLKKTPEISWVLVRYDGVLFQKEGSRSEIFS